MPNKLEEIIGNWYLGIFGDTNKYQLVLDARINGASDVLIEFIALSRLDIKRDKGVWSKDEYLLKLGDPIKDGITLDKLRPKTIKRIFQNAGV